MSPLLARTALVWALVLACTIQPCAAAPVTASTAEQWKGYVIHLFDYVSGYNRSTNPDPKLCSPPGTELYVGDDSGDGTLSVSAVKVSNDTRKYPYPTGCSAYIVQASSYTIDKATLQNERFTTQALVTGILAVPFKFHFSDHSTTAGSTLGAYVGYQTTFLNMFTITPILAGGLALISTAPAQATTMTASGTTSPSTNSSSQTATGFSVATGLIGSVLSGSNSSSGAQIGLLIGCDWLAKSSNYAYNGKPWIAFEVGYKFTP